VRPPCISLQEKNLVLRGNPGQRESGSEPWHAPATATPRS
jgi:hypothetical protein